VKVSCAGFFGVFVGAALAIGAAFAARKYLKMRASRENKETELPNQTPATNIFGVFAPTTETRHPSDPYMEHQ
jgi:hypothetical protein